MQKKLTLTIDEAVYYKLHSVIGERNISKFIERLVKPYVINEYLEAAYQDMAHDIAAEQEAYNWVEGLAQDGFHEKR